MSRFQLSRRSRSANPIQASISAVIQQLESRRMLSADPGVIEADGEVIDDGGTEEVIEYTLLDSEVKVDGDGETSDGEIVDGEVPEEWLYMTGVIDEGGEVVEDDVTTDDGEILYKNNEAGEEEIPLEEGPAGVDSDGDGVPDEILYMTGGPSALAPANLKPNGTLLIRGTAGADTIGVALSGGNVVVTLNGVDFSYDAAETDLIKVAAGAGNDQVTIDVDINSRVQGERGNDSITTGGGDDALLGGKGDDNLSGRGGDDLLGGGRGNDSLNGGDDADDLSGGRGADNLAGGLGNDQLRGGRGIDQMDAGAGNDFMNGGGGLDRLIAGSGMDAEQDANDAIFDPDSDDSLFASTRLAAPGWWLDDTGDASFDMIVAGDDTGTDTGVEDDEILA